MISEGSRTNHSVYLALGANMGERKKHLERALQALSTIATIQSVSSLYETAPIGYLDQPCFLNMVCFAETKLTPQALLQALKGIEVELGRKPTIQNGPRPIDIDILSYDNLQIQEETLIIPHPRMQERAFVLVPLAEIAPDFVPAGQLYNVRELLDRLPQQDIKKVT